MKQIYHTCYYTHEIPGPSVVDDLW